MVSVPLVMVRVVGLWSMFPFGGIGRRVVVVSIVSLSLGVVG